MIQASELRIGNWVLNVPPFHQNPYQVDGYHIWQVEKNEIEFNSVPLTDEIFNSIQHYQRGEISGPGMNYCHIAIGNDGVYYQFFEGQISSAPIKYLHELQNIYFALTKTELEITWK